MIMIYSLHSIVFYIIFMICFCHTIAERWISELEIPISGTTKSCIDWMTFYGFTSEGKDNRKLALERNRKVDGSVHMWAISYASYLVTFKLEVYPFGPYGFCELFLSTKRMQTYEPFNETRMTCEEWILFYGYNMMTEKIKLPLILHREKNEDNFNSIWATSYARFINKNSTKASMEPSKFCMRIGKDDPNHGDYKMPFMAISSTKLTCGEWIKLAGFSDDVKANIQKAQKQRPDYDEFMNHWAKSYTQFIRLYNQDDDAFPTPNNYCTATFERTTELLPFE